MTSVATWLATRCFGSSARPFAQTSTATRCSFATEATNFSARCLTASEARERFEQIAALTAVGTNHSVKLGLAEAEPADLIGRADDALLEARSSES
jgi:hypothetical protein